MALNGEQKIAYRDTFKSWRLGTSWDARIASAPCYTYTPRASLMPVPLGGQGTVTQSMSLYRPSILTCELAQGVQAQDFVKVLTGSLAGRFFNVRNVITNALANELECEMEETRDLPEGIS